MALGRRIQERQPSFWIAADELPRSEGHVFYRKLNHLLREAGFDAFVESLCEPYYHETLGRPGIPPGIYFRMLLVGYFEGLGAQPGIAWRLRFIPPTRPMWTRSARASARHKTT